MEFLGHRRRMHLDTEVRCLEPKPGGELKNAGAARWSRFESTEILIVSWSFEDEP